MDLSIECLTEYIERAVHQAEFKNVFSPNPPMDRDERREDSGRG